MNNNKITWTSEKRKISELNPAQYNPRELTEKQMQDLAQSLERFSLADPIVINQNNTIIGGHQRINILKAKYGNDGLEVDVRVPNRLLSQDEEVELNLRLNKNLGQWDFDALANFDEELLKSIGFESQELDKIFQLDLKPEDDDVPEVRTTDIKRGDLFTLGRHRVMCGDSTQKADVERLMDGKKADMVFTDPPYNIGYSYNVHDDKLKYEEYKEFCLRFFNLLNCEKIIITPGPRNVGIWYGIIDITDIGWSRDQTEDMIFDLGIWQKQNTRSGGGVFHLRQCEPIIFYGKFTRKRVFDVFVFTRKITSELRDARRKSNLTKVPPGKPVAFAEDVLMSFSEREETIEDIFGGNGTTLIACEKLNRKCRMMEIDPIYCQVIIDRWEKFTNGKAIKL